MSKPIDSLLRLGNIFELDFSFDALKVEKELEPFGKDWSHYNPSKPANPRKGLSVTSLDGGLSGTPDLHSLREYNRREGTAYRERDFSRLTPVFSSCKSIQPLLDYFRPHLGRTHFLKLEAGGFFPPHRDGADADEVDVIRILVPLTGVSKNSFVFLYSDQRVVLELGSTYVINTLVNHALFAFRPVTLLVCNVRLNHESLALIKKALAQR